MLCIFCTYSMYCTNVHTVQLYIVSVKLKICFFIINPSRAGFIRFLRWIYKSCRSKYKYVRSNLDLFNDNFGISSKNIVNSRFVVKSSMVIKVKFTLEN